MANIKVVHYINQFFAQIGGEEKADYPVELRKGEIVGPGMALTQNFKDDAEIIATIIYFTATSVILTNFWNARFKGSFTKKEEAMTLALEKQGRVGVDLASLTKDERKALVKEGIGLLKAKRQAEKAKEAK